MTLMTSFQPALRQTRFGSQETLQLPSLQEAARSDAMLLAQRKESILAKIPTELQAPARTIIEGLIQQKLVNPNQAALVEIKGPPGSGKTFLADALIEAIGGSNTRFSHFRHREDLNTALFNAPQGYVGYGREGSLESALKKGERPILTFDEADKMPLTIGQILSLSQNGAITRGDWNNMAAINARSNGNVIPGVVDLRGMTVFLTNCNDLPADLERSIKIKVTLPERKKA